MSKGSLVYNQMYLGCFEKILKADKNRLVRVAKELTRDVKSDPRLKKEEKIDILRNIKSWATICS